MLIIVHLHEELGKSAGKLYAGVFSRIVYVKRQAIPASRAKVSNINVFLQSFHYNGAYLMRIPSICPSLPR